MLEELLPFMAILFSLRRGDPLAMIRLDDVVRAFELASGLGSWAGWLEWLLRWIRGVLEVKLYGITVTADSEQTVKKTWERASSAGSGANGVHVEGL